MTAGKTTFALWHVRAVLKDGGHVIYVHFEEPDPEESSTDSSAWVLRRK
jgi:KaiC/GvpD/RAD55 family RecA-like ATPase